MTETMLSDERMGQLMHHFNLMEVDLHTVLATIPQLHDDVLLTLYAHASAVRGRALVVELRCAAEIKKRANLGPIGSSDVDGNGRMAGYRQLADGAGVSMSTVRRNAQIYETFEGVLTDQHTPILDKTIYDAALRTPDPQAAITHFIERSQVGELTASDARQYAAVERRKARAQAGQDVRGDVVYVGRRDRFRIVADVDTPPSQWTIELGNGDGSWIALDLDVLGDAREAAERLAVELVHQKGGSQ